MSARPGAAASRGAGRRRDGRRPAWIALAVAADPGVLPRAGGYGHRGMTDHGVTRLTNKLRLTILVVTIVGLAGLLLVEAIL